MAECAQSDAVTKRAFEALTARGRLNPSSACFRATPVTQNGEFCGLHFALYGPRDVLLTAVWDARASVLWCYDSRGERFQTLTAFESESETNS